MTTPSFGPIRQIAWIVRDLEESLANWLRISGVGPWTCFRNVAMTGKFRGAPAAVRMHVALGYQDGMEIELIQDLGGAASPYRGADGAPLGATGTARGGQLRDSDPFVGATTGSAQPNYCVSFEMNVP